MARFLRKCAFWVATLLGLVGITSTGVAWWGSWFLWPFPDPRVPGESEFNGSLYKWCGPQAELWADHQFISIYNLYGIAHVNLLIQHGRAFDEEDQRANAEWSGRHFGGVYTHPDIEADPWTVAGDRRMLRYGDFLVSLRHVTSQNALPDQPLTWQYWKLDVYVPHWLLTLLWFPLLLPFAVRLRRRRRSARWQRQGRCIGCGYNLAHLESTKCPECGQAATSTPGAEKGTSF